MREGGREGGRERREGGGERGVRCLLSHFGLREFELDFGRRLLRVSEGVDHRLILQNVPGRFREQLQDAGFDLPHLLDHGSVVHHQLVFHLSQIWALLRHTHLVQGFCFRILRFMSIV